MERAHLANRMGGPIYTIGKSWAVVNLEISHSATVESLKSISENSRDPFDENSHLGTNRLVSGSNSKLEQEETKTGIILGG